MLLQIANLSVSTGEITPDSGAASEGDIIYPKRDLLETGLYIGDAICVTRDFSVEHLDAWQALYIVDARGCIPQEYLLPEEHRPAGDFGAVDCTVSVDGGDSWLRWDDSGDSWESAGDAWTPLDVASYNIGALSWARRLRIRLRLRPSENLAYAPSVLLIGIAYSALDGYQEQDAIRTMRRLIAGFDPVRLRGSYPVLAGAESLDLGYRNVTEVDGVYNLNTDPTRTTDISGALSSGGIVAIQEPETDCTVEAQFRVQVPVIVAHRDSDLNGSDVDHVPTLILRVMRAVERQTGREPETESHVVVDYPRMRFWKVSMPIPVEYQVLVYAVSPDESFSDLLIGSLRSALRTSSHTERRRTALLGSLYEVSRFLDFYVNLTDSSQRASVKAVRFVATAHEWRPTSSVGSLAQSVEIKHANRVISP